MKMREIMIEVGELLRLEEGRVIDRSETEKKQMLERGSDFFVYGSRD